ncbi:MAG: S1 RNA-binding domain-containing protein [Chloroflexota bacterium]
MKIRQHSLDTLEEFLHLALQRADAPREDEREAERPSEPTDWAPNGGHHSRATAAEWDEARRIFASGECIRALVTGWNRGGLLVRWHELQGFVPVSQLKEIPLFEDDASRDEELARWVGEELYLRVIELDPSRNRLVFSERATIWGPEQGDRVLQEICAGQVLSGHVSNLCEFGAFVDLGGVDGLIHISELSWGRVNHPRETLKLGQQVEAYVLSVDKDKRRIALSLKRLQPNPWTVVERTHYVGEVIPASITNIVEFGAFAQIEEGLEGLIHISELCEQEVRHASEVVSMGDRVKVRILRIDSAGHRLGLSMRQADAAAGDSLEPPAEGEWGGGRASLY